MPELRENSNRAADDLPLLRAPRYRSLPALWRRGATTRIRKDIRRSLPVPALRQPSSPATQSRLAKRQSLLERARRRREHRWGLSYDANRRPWPHCRLSAGNLRCPGRTSSAHQSFPDTGNDLPEIACVVEHNVRLESLPVEDCCGVGRRIDAFIYRDWWSLYSRWEFDLRELKRAIAGGLQRGGDIPRPFDA